MQRKSFPRDWLAWICWTFVVLFSSVAAAQEELDPNQTWSAKLAIALWLGLAILAVLIIGIGLMWAVSRGAKLIKKKREPVHTEMKNIWYLNPPETRKQDEP